LLAVVILAESDIADDIDEATELPRIERP